MKILVAGIGNIFQGDDAFGCDVVKRLTQRGLPPEVRLFDFGIRGLDLTYSLMDNPDLVILIDATPQGHEPGTLYIIEPEWDGDEPPTFEAIETHGMHPVQVLRTARAMGAKPGRVLLVGCEPGDLGGEEGLMGLTPPVAAAIDEAVGMVEELIQQLMEVTV